MARARSKSPNMDMYTSRHSNTPPPQPQSKRDKRRAIMAEKLQELVNSFNANLRPHYEAQANAIQVDISLILRADPYQNKPLDDDPEAIAEQIRAVVGDKIGQDSAAEADFTSRAGRMYSDYIQHVNDAMEERDINLNLLHSKYQNSLKELQERHEFQVRLAKEEHRILSETVRERLVTSLTKRRERLLKEKEQLDIGDSNALLLHPNQYSLVNPASPGNAHRRATRGIHRRGGADPEEPGEKRKRKPLFQEVEGQSPAPGAGAGYDAGNLTPYNSARAKNVYHQHEASAYSVDRLFTDKELQMTMNRAAIAATNFMVKLKTQKNGQANGDLAANGDGEDAVMGNDAADNEPEADEEANSLAAPEMERVTSHQTRGATRALLADQAAQGMITDFPLRSTMPTYIPAVIGTKANSAPTTTQGLSAPDIEQDLAMITRDTDGDDVYNNRLLERAGVASSTREYSYRPPSIAGEGHEASLGGLQALPTLGGVPMSAQSSMAGISEVGGLAMSRTNSAMGGLGMKRTASSQNLLGVETAKRTRGRA